MNLEILYTDKSNVFMEGVTNISVSTTQIYFEYKQQEIKILVKDIKTATLFTDDWQHTIRHWRYR